MTEEKKQALELLKQSKHTVMILGVELLRENGYPNYRDNEELYEVESRYGYSMGELYSARFYETRTLQFFNFYRDAIVYEKEPPQIYYLLAKMQQMGYLKEIITRDIYDLPLRAGCKDVIALNGSIYQNWCQKCGRQYLLSDITKEKGVPLCETCKDKIRPNILLIGETMNNAIMTKAVNAVEEAELLIVLGANLIEDQIGSYVRNFQGKALIVINEDLALQDENADIMLEENAEKMIKEFLEEL